MSPTAIVLFVRQEMSSLPKLSEADVTEIQDIRSASRDAHFLLEFLYLLVLDSASLEFHKGLRKRSSSIFVVASAFKTS